MKKYLLVLAVSVSAFGVYYFVTGRTVRPRTAATPITFTPSDFVRDAASGTIPIGTPVRIVLRYALFPTDDPLVWEYRPSDSIRSAVLFRVHLVAPLESLPRPGDSVSGILAEFTPDHRGRVHGVRGFFSVRLVVPSTP